METRRTNKKNVFNLKDRVDTGANSALAFAPRGEERGQGAASLGSDKAHTGKRGTIIHEDVWYEFVLIAQYLYRKDPEAEVADVFEWLRMEDMGGTPISEGLLKRVNREIATELGDW